MRFTASISCMAAHQGVLDNELRALRILEGQIQSCAQVSKDADVAAFQNAQSALAKLGRVSRSIERRLSFLSESSDELRRMTDRETAEQRSLENTMRRLGIRE